LKKIIFTVTNDLTYDQRMQRICTSVSHAGYDVLLVGRRLKNAIPLNTFSFKQKRLSCWTTKGKLFYLEYNLRLFFYLLFTRFDAVCSIDLDTILPGFYSAKLKRKVCVYDAHEYFTEVPEVVERPTVKRVWEWVAQHTIPRLRHCYTVCDSLADLFTENYGTAFGVIRNVPVAQEAPSTRQKNDRKVILYQGALNDGRGLEEMITAMQVLDADLWIAGEGDLSQELRTLAEKLNLQEKVKFLGFVTPDRLKALTFKADIGINLLKNKGLSYYYSLANKAFDYIQAELPSVNMNFPEYQRINIEFKVGLLVDDLETSTLINTFNSLLNDSELYAELVNNCKKAKKVFIWEEEEKKLVQIYNQLFISSTITHD